MNKLISFLALTLVASGSAIAADIVVEAPVEPVPADHTWTGAYVGVQAGYGFGESTFAPRGEAKYGPGLQGTVTPEMLDEIAAAGRTNWFGWEPIGFIGGVYAGYNYQLQKGLVVGIDGNFSYSNLSDEVRIPREVPGDQSPLPQLYDYVGFESTTNWTASARARVGYAIDRFLPYIAGGVAFADYEVSGFVDHHEDGRIDGRSYSETMTGWTIGAGAEYAFHQ